jgi:hypothetical protein
MKPFATKALSATTAAPSFGPKSELWIQHELDVATLNAEKNRSIQGSVVRARPQSSRKKSVLITASDAQTQRADPHISTRSKSVTLSVCEKPLNKIQELSTNNLSQGYRLISKQGVAEEHSKGISSLRTQIQCMIGEWSCAIKQAIFQEEMGLNDSQHTPQLLVLL